MQIINWHKATEHPEKDCSVVVILATDSKQSQMNTVMGVVYENGYFNGKEYNMNDRVVCWAYIADFETIFNHFKKEGDPNEKTDAARCGSGISEDVR